ncbi:MAG: Ig-like domain-containing protein [Chloroflexota bacterium]|jgi:hypothetical protein|nr:Ig-like domain-containing protein [Chloroflexota bacterium]
MYYYVKENPTKLYYERHPLLVEHAKSASLTRKVHIWRALLMSSRSRTVVATVGFFAAAIMALCLLLVAKPAHAATFTVDRNDDPDPAIAKACTAAPSDCSLRGAIVATNAASGADGITLAAETYTLSREGVNEDAASTGDLDVTDELTITGAGARATSVAGGPAPFDDQIFENHAGAKTTITDLTVTGGDGGVTNNEGDLTLDRVAVTGNTADLAAFVGGVYGFKGTLNLTDSTVSGNSSTNQAGVLQLGGTANITNTTISGNKATQVSGGVFSAFLDGDTTMNILNSTIANNESSRLGGGIMTQLGAAVFVKNTIVAGNTVENCNAAQFGGVISSQGNNISSDDSCPFTKPADKQNTDPLLGPLQDNGGPTNTHALLPGSPAIDAANATACPERDQRAIVRKDGDKNGTVVCDTGSFERSDLTPPKVNTMTPTAGKRGVKRNTDLTANFSERMNRATLNKATFKLFKVNRDGSTTQIRAVSVSSSTDGLKATLDPDSTLGANTKYEAVVSTGAKDVAENRLDQDRKRPKDQPMEWFFTTGSS